VHEEADAAIVQAISGLGRQLGLRVVAEGVEDEATLRAVAEWGATLAQGYYISRPAPAEDLAAMLSSSSSLRGPWTPSPPESLVSARTTLSTSRTPTRAKR
jgi:EAL domain-containing protein (putative c-di-GMP-specific phosphodiesterase class I)